MILACFSFVVQASFLFTACPFHHSFPPLDGGLLGNDLVAAPTMVNQFMNFH
jgi:hypothetical protein